jgi:hypothetical protein
VTLSLIPAKTNAPGRNYSLDSKTQQASNREKCIQCTTGDPVKDEMKSAFTSVSKSQVFLLASSKEIFPCRISRRKNID